MQASKISYGSLWAVLGLIAVVALCGVLGRFASDQVVGWTVGAVMVSTFALGLWHYRRIQTFVVYVLLIALCGSVVSFVLTSSDAVFEVAVHPVVCLLEVLGIVEIKEDCLPLFEASVRAFIQAWNAFWPVCVTFLLLYGGLAATAILSTVSSFLNNLDLTPFFVPARFQRAKPAKPDGSQSSPLDTAEGRV